MATAAVQRRSNVQAKLQLEVDRMLYVRNLPAKITVAEMHDIFGKFGPINSIRIGKTSDSIGTAFIVYDDIFHAQNAAERLKGAKIGDQYPVILYYRNKISQRADVDKLKKKREKIGKIRPKLILSDD